MLNSNDRRVARTRTLIRNTFAELIVEKGLDRVTIKDLTERADINRGTFYLHFQDKYDLLEQSEEKILKGMKKIAKELDTLDVGDWDKTTAPPSAAVKYFAFLKENAMFLKAILGPKGDPAFPSKMKYLIANQIKSRFAHVEQNVTQFPPDYLVAYLVSAHLGVVQHWIETGHKESPQEMAHIISSMNFYGPLAVGRWK